MSTLWLNETALDIVANLESNAAAKACTLSTGQMLAIAFLLLALVLGTIIAAIAALWCALYSGWMCCYRKKKRRKRRVAFDDGESNRKKHRFIEEAASAGTMIAREVSPRVESRRSTVRKVVFQEVVDVHRSCSPSLMSVHSSFNPLHRSISLVDFRSDMARIALSSFSLDCVHTEELPGRFRADIFPNRQTLSL